MEGRWHLAAPGTCLRLAAPERLLSGRCRLLCPKIEYKHLRIRSVAERDRLGFRQLQSVAFHNTFSVHPELASDNMDIGLSSPCEGQSMRLTLRFMTRRSEKPFSCGFLQLPNEKECRDFSHGKRVAPRSPALRISFMLTPKCIASKRAQLREEYDRRKTSETGLNHRLNRLNRRWTILGT